MSDSSDATYEAAKLLARSDDPDVRRGLAARADTRPELLYYLANDAAPEVRLAVAGNAAAPAQASVLLASDAVESVRRVLATKLARLLPDLGAEAHEQVHRLTMHTLATLARDQALSVRQALATVLKDVACAPPRICLDLARDVAREVAEPILHYCVTLTDRDLLTIIANQPMPWVLEAIARREALPAAVATAIYEAGLETGEERATGTLIGNAGADIPVPTLARMVEDSMHHKTWQEPLARRPTLPPGLAVRLAQFVDQHVLAILSQRGDFDPLTAAEIVAVVRRRLDFHESQDAGELPERRARRLHAAGRLDEPAVSDALSWSDLGFVRAALALRSGLGAGIVDAILAAQSPKGVTALAWKAGLSMRCAMQLQARGANIPPRLLLNARNGVDYPLSPIEMAWQLEFYGAGPAGRGG